MRKCKEIVVFFIYFMYLPHEKEKLQYLSQNEVQSMEVDLILCKLSKNYNRICTNRIIVTVTIKVVVSKESKGIFKNSLYGELNKYKDTYIIPSKYRS